MSKTKTEILTEYQQIQQQIQQEQTNLDSFNSEEMKPYANHFTNIIRGMVDPAAFLMLMKSNWLHKGGENPIKTFDLPNFTDWFNTLQD